MTAREALLAAIIDHPDEDTPRLVYADFLDETGDRNDVARARLIRTQIEAARLPADAPERAELQKLIGALWDHHKSAWFAGIGSDRLPYPERGFIKHWGCYSVHQLAEKDAPFAREPISELTLAVNHPAELAGVESWPELARIREFKVWPTSTDDAALVRLFSSPYLTGVRKLDVMGNVARPWSPVPDAMGILATLPQYSTLEELSITHAEVGDEGARRLASSPTLRRVTALGLSGCDIGRAGWASLLASPVVSSVRSLGLGGAARTDEAGEALAAALAGSRELTQLESIALDETAFTDRAARELAGGSWPAFRRLLICPHPVNHSDQVTGYSTMTARGIESLAAGIWATTIESLYLSSHAIGDAGAAALARGRRLQNLRSLTLMDSGITGRGIAAIVEAYAGQLELLQLARNPLGDAGAEVIARAAWPRMVPQPAGVEYSQRGILMALCGIGEAGAKALARSKSIPREIPDLFLGNAQVSDSVVARLRARFPNATIRY